MANQFIFEKIFDGGNGSDNQNPNISPENITLGWHTDGLLYVFVDGKPVGNGVALPSDGASGDVTGNIDSENNFILSGGDIVAGQEYSFYYKFEDGSEVLIGSKVLEEVEEPDEPELPNLIVTSVNTDGTAFGTKGIEKGKRWSSSGGLSNGQANTTGLIACEAGDIVHLEKCGLYNQAGSTQAHRVTFWDASKTYLGYEQPWSLKGTYMTDVQLADGFVTQFTVKQDGFFAVSGINNVAADAFGVTDILDENSKITITKPNS